ncbi:hypothetical protein EJB05_23553, partial [Eragrostis curvula]
MENYVNLFSIEDLDDWLPRQLGTLNLMESRSRRWIKAKDMLDPSKCWLEARVAEETVEEPRRVKMKSRIEEMIKMDFRGKPPYDTESCKMKKFEEAEEKRSPYDTVTVSI